MDKIATVLEQVILTRGKNLIKLTMAVLGKGQIEILNRKKKQCNIVNMIGRDV